MKMKWISLLSVMVTLVGLGLGQPAKVSAFESKIPADASAPLANATTGSETSADTPPGRDDRTDRLIVKFKDESLARSKRVDNGVVQSLSARAGIQLQHHHSMSGNGQVFKLPKRMARDEVEAVARQLAEDPDVEYAVPDRLMFPLQAPNDPSYASQWDFNSPNNEKAGSNLPAAWDITTGSTSVVVGVIDTGIVTHADLQGRILPGYNFISDPVMAGNGIGRSADASDLGDWTTNPDGSVATPSSWHGTHVAGTIAAIANNGTGVAGMNWKSKILPVRVLGKGGGYMSDIIDGMRWAAGLSVPGVPANANPAKVLNLSLGGSATCDSATQSAINEVIAAGTVVVVAAGNDNDDAANYTPASCSGVVSVAAVNRAGGATFYTNFGSTVKIAAPGGDNLNAILSTLNTGTTSPVASPAGDTYRLYYGTSMATPHVAGTVSLMLSLQPALTPVQVLEILQNTARPFPTGTGSVDCTTSVCGSGILDAYRAVAAVSATGPSLIADPLALSFTTHQGDPAPPSQSLAIWNAGGGTLHWSVTSSAPWIHVTPTSGQESGTVTVSLDTSALSPATATTGSITLTTDGTANPPLTIPVTLNYLLKVNAPVPVAVSGHAQVAVGGKLYVIGGFSTPNLVQIYDTAANTWTTGMSKPTAGIYINAAAINGKIYVPGGYNGQFNQSNNVYNTLEIYDTATDRWSTGAPMPTAMTGGGVEAVNGKLYVLGGVMSGDTPTPASYVYDPAVNTWTRLADKNTNGDYFGSGVVGSKIYVFGGSQSGAANTTNLAAVFDTVANTWSPVASLHAARFGNGGASLAGKLYAFGGSNYMTLPHLLGDVESFDPTTNTWSYKPLLLNQARYNQKASVSGNTIYIIGGNLPTGASNLNESYTEPTLVAGVCGSSNGQTFSVTPTTGLCASGTASAVTGSGPWSWTCYGANGGASASCSATSIVITNASPLATGRQGYSYSVTLAASNGLAPYTWSIVSGALPTGLSLNSSTGTIAGTPSAGTFSFTVQATDAGGQSGQKAFSLTILPPPILLVGNASNYYFYGIQDAYNYSASNGLLSGTTMKLSGGMQFPETLRFDQNFAFTLSGGFDDYFTASSGRTIVSGKLTVTNGKVKVDGVSVR